jgi:hypothetical protein
MSNPPNEPDLGEISDLTSWPYANDQPTQIVRISREETFLAWVGRREKLLRIATEVEQALASAYKQLLLDRNLDPGTSDGDREKADGLAQQLQPSVTVLAGKGRMRRSGNLEAILNDMDAREIECITMGNGHRYPSPGKHPEIFLQMGHGDQLPLFDRNIVRLKVSGPDRQWVGGVFDLLAGEIRKDVPWWAFMRSTLASVLFATLLVGGLFPLFLMMGPQPVNEDPVTLFGHIGLNVTTGIVMAGTGSVFLRSGLRRIFPAVEVLDAGATAQGRQVLAIAVSVLTFAMGAAGVVLGFMAL